MNVRIDMADKDNEDKTILLIANRCETTLFTEKQLQKNNYLCLVAETGKEGLAAANKLKPHLIIIDVDMTDGNAYQVCSTLKKKSETKAIPLILLCDNVSIDEQVKGIRFGACDFIPKPVHKEILLCKVSSYITLCKSERYITQQKEELANTKNELLLVSQALDNASDGVLMTDITGKIYYTNMAFGYMSFLALDDIQNRNIPSFFSDRNKLEKILSNSQEDTSFSLETLLFRSDHNDLPVLLRCTTVTDDLFQPLGMMFLITDLTSQKDAESERKRLEVELFHSQKLESVGHLAAGIAHEINTPIQFVGDNIRFIKDAMLDIFNLYEKQEQLLRTAKEKIPETPYIKEVENAKEDADIEFLTEELPKSIEQSLEGVRRVASIVRAMKEFAHPGKSEKNPADLNEAIETTIIVARNKWKYDAKLVSDLDESLPPVPCLIGEINQVILNLIINAADAIHDHRGENGELGIITLSTHHTKTMAEIRVQDSGGGIPECIQKKIFDPFFTTKEVGRGSGQGLAIGRGVIVNKHNGEFFFETTVGESTTFIIRLPLFDK